MNASSFVGRLTPGFFAHSLGIDNMVAAAAGCGAVVILGMIGLRSITSVVVLGVLYGFCAGVCPFFPLRFKFIYSILRVCSQLSR
jgi:hypothetical protein